jgi:hypothetical protein
MHWTERPSNIVLHIRTISELDQMHQERQKPNNLRFVVTGRSVTTRFYMVTLSENFIFDSRDATPAVRQIEKLGYFKYRFRM